MTNVKPPAQAIEIASSFFSPQRKTSIWACTHSKWMSDPVGNICPTEVARAVAYVLGNYFHHAANWGEAIAREIMDPYSSAAEHEKGWTGMDPPLVVEPRTWLLRVGWERGGATRLAG